MYAQDAIELLKGLTHSIQVLHAEARRVSEESGIPFALELDSGLGYTDMAKYSPKWESSSYSC